MSEVYDIDLDLDEPKAVLEFGVVKIHLEGVKALQEQWIESLKYKAYQTDEEREQAGLIYIKRVITSCIRKVEGLSIKGVPFDVTIDPKTNCISDKDYNTLLKIFDKIIQKDFTMQTMDFYNKNIRPIELDNVVVKEDKKKD